jgi:hypothetical protein
MRTLGLGTTYGKALSGPYTCNSRWSAKACKRAGSVLSHSVVSCSAEVLCKAHSKQA